MMDREKLIERLKHEHHGYSTVENDPETAFHDLVDCLTHISTLQAENKKLRAELEQVKRCIEIVENQRDQMKRERDAAIDCIYKIEDALDRGNDNDWAREHISEWESQKED